jgi:hypothetical protein
MTPNEALNDVAVTIAAPVEPAKKPEPAEKLYTFKVLRATNFAEPDFMIIDVDEDGNWLEPRRPESGEYGPHTKIWPDTIISVNGPRAKSFDQHSIGKRVEKYD